MIYQCNHSQPPCPPPPPLSQLHCADSWPQFWEAKRAPDVWKFTVLLHRTGVDVLLYVIIKVVNKD